MAEAPQAEPVPSASEAEAAPPPESKPEFVLEDDDEPLPKKRKVSEADANKLEHRLGGILCCAVCLDLPPAAVYQCTNGHLMCAPCFTHLLADARLRDEAATCPNCRVEISKLSASRNLAVEKTVSELPSECKYCTQVFPRHSLQHHEEKLCEEREYKFAQIVVAPPAPVDRLLFWNSLVRIVSQVYALLLTALRRTYLVPACAARARPRRRYLRQRRVPQAHGVPVRGDRVSVARAGARGARARGGVHAPAQVGRRRGGGAAGPRATRRRGHEALHARHRAALLREDHLQRSAAEAVPHGGVRAQVVLRVVAFLGVRPPVGGEGVRQQAPARPHAELAAGTHLPADREVEAGVAAAAAVGGAARAVRRGAAVGARGGAHVPRGGRRLAARAAAARRPRRHQPPALQQGHTLQTHHVPIVEVVNLHSPAARNKYGRFTLAPFTHTLGRHVSTHLILSMNMCPLHS